MITGRGTVGAQVLKGGAGNGGSGTDGFWIVEGCPVENAGAKV